MSGPQCCAAIYKGSVGIRSRYASCTRAGKVERDGKWYCGQHDPEAVKARRQKADERLDAQIAEEMRVGRIRAAAPTLLEALKALLLVPEIADCDPRDKDPETQVAERNARAAIAAATGDSQ